jgi:hypothetical protein
VHDPDEDRVVHDQFVRLRHQFVLLADVEGALGLVDDRR